MLDQVSWKLPFSENRFSAVTGSVYRKREMVHWIGDPERRWTAASQFVITTISEFSNAVAIGTSSRCPSGETSNPIRECMAARASVLRRYENIADATLTTVQIDKRRGIVNDFQIEVEIHAPSHCVWAIMRDVERWPDWTPTVKSVRLMNAKSLAVGSRAIIRQPKLPPAKWRVAELDDARKRFTWISTGPGIRVIACHWVESCGENSRATLSLKFSGVLAGLFAYITRGLNDRYLVLEANGLKQYCESHYPGLLLEE